MNSAPDRNRASWIGGIFSTIIVLSVAALVALILASAAVGCGGVALAVAPERSFGTVAPVVCHADEELRYWESRQSYHRPGEATPHAECVGGDGRTRDVTGSAIATFFLGVFCVAFLVAFLPMAVLGGVVTSRIRAAARARR